jgi:hypothetical protein
MPERIDVMISSTAQDLPAYRQQAMEASMRQGMFPIMMEHLPALDADAIEASLAMVEDAEIYLGIFARRYGYVPQGHEISITEMEYNHALERGIPRLIFILDDSYAEHLPTEADPAQNARLAALIARLKAENVVEFFTSPDNFRAAVIDSLARIKLRRTAAMHRPSFIPSPPQAYIAHPYTLLESGHLFGRQAELDLLNQWLRSEGQFEDIHLLNLVAIGGMGKSSLAWKWFQDQARQQKPLAGSLWWSFYESDAHYENFITRSLAYVSGQNEEALRRKTLTQREDDLFILLNQQPYLLVLDGLERLLIAYNRENTSSQHEFAQAEATSPRPASSTLIGMLSGAIQGAQRKLRKTTDPRAGAFLRKLATAEATKTLISSRLYPSDLETATGAAAKHCLALFLQGLDDQDALELWRSFGISGDEDHLLELFHAFANYPLLIRALAGEVAGYRRAPRDFDQWRAAHQGFNPFGLPMVQRQTHVLQYALQGLEDSHLAVLRTIGAFNSPTSYGTLADLLIGPDRTFGRDPELDTALSELEDRGLLGWDREANRYDLHPVIRGIVWNSLDRDKQRNIHEQIRSYLEALPKLDNWRKVRNRAEMVASIDLYRTLIHLERYDEAADLFSNRLYRPLRYTFSDGQTLVHLLEMLFEAPIELGEPARPLVTKPQMQTWCLNALGQAEQIMGQVARAVPLFEQANQLKEALHYTVELSSGFRDLSYAQRLSGRLYAAEYAARRAALLDQEDGNGLLEALSLQVLGLALAARGAYAESAKALDYSLDLADRTGANRAYNHQALRALWYGDHSAAFDWSDKAIAYYKQKRLEHGLILSYRLNGQAATHLGMLGLAEDHLVDALKRARAANLMEEELAALIALADLYRRRKFYAEAREALEMVWDACESAPYRLLHAEACNTLAALERDLGDQGAAIGAATRAYELAWCEGPPYSFHHALLSAEGHLAVLGLPIPLLAPSDGAAWPPMPPLPLLPPS